VLLVFGSGEPFELAHGPGPGFPDFGRGVLSFPGAEIDVLRHGLSPVAVEAVDPGLDLPGPGPATDAPEAEVRRFLAVEIGGAQSRVPGFVETDPQAGFLCFVAVESRDPEADALHFVVTGSADPGLGAPETAGPDLVAVEPMVPWIGDSGSVAI